MKKYLTIVLFLLCIGNAYAQIETKVFQLDLSKPNKKSLKVKDTASNEKSLTINTKQLLSFELINVNPLRYDYTIGHHSINFHEENISSPFKEIERAKDKTDKNLLNDENNIKNLEQNFKLATNNKEKLRLNNQLYLSQKEILKSKKTELEKEIFNIEDKSSYNTFLSTDIKNFQEERKQVISKFDIQIKGIDSLIENNNKLITKNKITTTRLKEELKKEKELRKLTIELKEEENKVIKQGIITKLKIEAENLEFLFEKIEGDLQILSSKEILNKNDFENEREKYKKEYQKIINSINDLSEEASNINGFSIQYNKELEFVKESTIKIKAILSKILSLKFEYYFLPIDINGENIDVVEISLKRDLKEGKESKLFDEYKYNIWIKGGIKIDVSAGIFFTSLIDEDFYTINKTIQEQGEEKTVQLIYKNDKGNYKQGVGSMINVSTRLGTSWITPSLSFGAIIKENQKFEFLAGIGLKLGKRDRVILHGGITMGSIKKIATLYKADGITTYTLVDGVVPTTDKFSFGKFFGITYNLGKIKSQNKVETK